jgi:ribosomal protein L7/L12
MDPAIYQAISGLRQRLDAVESQLEILSAKAGVPYQKPDEVPPEVRALVAAGKRIDAIKALRAASGLSLEEAKAIVDRM